MKRKILIEALGTNRVGGGRTAIHTLLEHMLGLDQETPFIVLVSEHEPSWDKYSNVHQHVISGGRFAVRVHLQRQLPAWVRRERIALVHFTKNLGVFGVPCPYVVTVHDLTTLLLRDQHTLLDVIYWRWVEPLTVCKAAGVVAVSHDTARDIERFYGVPQQNIEVIYWAPHARFMPIRDPHRLQSLRQRYRLPARYVLFVGILAKKKNMPTLLRGMALLHARMPDAPGLVVAGRQYPQSHDTVSVTLVSQLGLGGHVHFVGSVPDEDLPLFYAASELYVLPSLHEGFGIPTLEAMACGVPVIIARTGALPEIVSDAALVLDDPMDAASLCAAMERLLRDEILRQETIRRGFRRAAAFSWERSARRMLDVYHRVLEGHGYGCQTTGV
jgi:glycosyltransferase involved in cell wall biosynthesis